MATSTTQEIATLHQAHDSVPAVLKLAEGTYSLRSYHHDHESINADIGFREQGQIDRQ